MIRYEQASFRSCILDTGIPMQPTLHFPRFVAASLGLHALFIAVVAMIAVRAAPPPSVTPVDIVNLPKDVLRKLPPLSPPVPAVPARPVPRGYSPPKEFGTAPDIALPRTAPGLGQPEGSNKGKADTGTGKSAPRDDLGKGPLPFLSQADIDALARKGMPEAKPGDNSVTLDTDEFKFISYNRWLKIQVERVLKYPELAAVSGIQGTLFIKFDIMKDGSLGGLELLKSSGYKILDDEALRAIRDSAPFPPLPEQWHMDHYPIRAAVLFYLNAAYIR
jgi:protein TonB